MIVEATRRRRWVRRRHRDALYLRGYEERVHHSLILRQVRCGAAAPAAGHLAFRVAEEADLDRLAAFFQERGCPLRWLEPGEEPGQGRALRVQDPVGFPVEFFCAMEPAERLLQRFDRYRGAHVMRLDHFNCTCSMFRRPSTTTRASTRVLDLHGALVPVRLALLRERPQTVT